jgi:hypothetical protein
MLQIKNSYETLPGSALLRRQECAEALTQAGFRTSSKTLATKVTRGDGPPYHKFGRTVLYRWSDVLAWAEARLSPPMTSSSEADTARSVEE